jgi:hypothetical protein
MLALKDREDITNINVWFFPQSPQYELFLRKKNLILYRANIAHAYSSVSIT